jgi:hypothetical protein
MGLRWLAFGARSLLLFVERASARAHTVKRGNFVTTE